MINSPPDGGGRQFDLSLVVYLILCENQPGNVTFIPKHVWFRLSAKMPGGRGGCRLSVGRTSSTA